MGFGTMKISTNQLTVLLILSALGIASPAHAVLGERVDSLHTEMAALPNPQLTVTKSDGYSVHEIKSDDNTIKEFADKNGLVFAVSWSGIHSPDLRKLFGSHFQSYKSALASHEKNPLRPSRAPVEVKNDDIVVRTGGHMRAVRGFAYLPSRVPDGISIQDLK